MNNKIKSAVLVSTICAVLGSAAFQIQANSTNEINKLQDISVMILSNKEIKDNIGINLKTNNFNNLISQNYEIQLGRNIDLSKITIKFYYDELGKTEEKFWCDHSSISLKQAPWYKDIYIESICKLINDIKMAPGARIDGMGMQSHYTMWGLKDDQSWLMMPEHVGGRQHYPLLFDRNYQAKPAYWGVVNSLRYSQYGNH